MEVRIIDYKVFIANRITQLRMEKGVSARDMSLSLGQSESYINKIENGRTMPSIDGLIYICEYFEIEPKDFFDTEAVTPQKSKELMSLFGRLSPSQSEHILFLIKDLTKKEK